MAYRYKLKQNLKEEGRITFQNERITAFKEIEERLNNLYKLVNKAENETVDYYNENPTSYNVVYPTDIMLDYLDDMQKLFEKREE